jgi:hypothetical protein
VISVPRLSGTVTAFLHHEFTNQTKARCRIPPLASQQHNPNVLSRIHIKLRRQTIYPKHIHDKPSSPRRITSQEHILSPSGRPPRWWARNPGARSSGMKVRRDIYHILSSVVPSHGVLRLETCAFPHRQHPFTSKANGIRERQRAAQRRHWPLLLPWRSDVKSCSSIR